MRWLDALIELHLFALKMHSIVRMRILSFIKIKSTNRKLGAQKDNVDEIFYCREKNYRPSARGESGGYKLTASPGAQ